MRCIDLTLRSKEKSQSLSVQSSTDAVGDVAGAIDQNVERAELAPDRACQRVDIVLRPHVELLALLGLQTLKLVLGDVGGDDLRAFGNEGLGNGAADALPCRGHQRDFAFQSVAHVVLTLSAHSTPQD